MLIIPINNSNNHINNNHINKNCGNDNHNNCHIIINNHDIDDGNTHNEESLNGGHCEAM
jgi:hypothetical protein